MTSLADLHLHTTASDGTLSPQALLNEVLVLQMIMPEPKLRVIAVTDHDNLAGAWTAIDYLHFYQSDADLEIIPGSEISTSDGHIVALRIREDIQKGMSAQWTIDAIHEQGGLAIAAHPYASGAGSNSVRGIRGLIAGPLVGGRIDAVETRNASPTGLLSNLYTQWVNYRNLRLPEVGSSNSHFRSATGRATTSFPGRTADDLVVALRKGTTRAVGGVYGPLSLLEYYRDRNAWKRFCESDPIHRVYHIW